MAYLIKATDEVSEVFPANGRKFTLAELQSLVGGYIEIVRIGRGEVLVLNEDGLRLELPTNERATEIADRAGVLMFVTGIMGNAVRCADRDIE